MESNALHYWKNKTKKKVQHSSAIKKNNEAQLLVYLK